MGVIGQLKDCYCKLKDRVDDLELSASPTLQVTTDSLYEYETVWAEEGAALDNNTAEWSFGNGATGFMGLPFSGNGWEITGMGAQADVGNNAVDLRFDLVDYGANPSAAAPVLASLTFQWPNVEGALNNMWKWEDFTTPIPTPDDTYFGFLTRELGGNASDVRVKVRMRRLVGQYVTSVSLT